jgi:competence protein ComEA
MNKSLTVVLGAALFLSVGFNGYLYQLLQKAPEIVYVQAPAEEETPVAEEFLYVHVTGAVNQPGVYLLPVGSRAFAAIDKAGGCREEADLDRINLARTLLDGEQIIIYQKVAHADTPSPPAPAIPADTRVNINTASQKELETLPGIGPAKATAIINYRTQHGMFRVPEDLKKVSGIGDVTYDGLKHLIRLK